MLYSGLEWFDLYIYLTTSLGQGDRSGADVDLKCGDNI